MTKARDLANSAAAFASVSATELGFVDGVTSAIQTQMDAKAPSSTAVTLTGTQTLTNKTLTSPVIASVINNTLTSTTGDIIYASAANTPARLGIGTTGQVLNVASGVPAWATPATPSSGLNLISTQTLSSATSTSFNNCFTSTYTHYMIIVSGGFVAGVTDINMRLRESGTDNTSANYFFFTIANTASNVLNQTAGAAGSSWTPGYGSTSTQGFQIYVYSPQVSGIKTAYSGTFISRYQDKGGGTAGFFDANTSFDGFTLFSSNAMVGNISVYGLAN